MNINAWQDDADIPFEEDLLSNPFSVKSWLRYLDFKSDVRQPSFHFFAIACGLALFATFTAPLFVTIFFFIFPLNLCALLCALCSVLCALFFVLYALRSALCALRSALCAVAAFFVLSSLSVHSACGVCCTSVHLHRFQEATSYGIATWLNVASTFVRVRHAMLHSIWLMLRMIVPSSTCTR
jgi:hypothetical protein